MVIYLDIILLMNMAIDTLLLWFTAYFRKERVVWWRIIAASVFGSAYLIFFFLPTLAVYNHWMVKLLMSLVMLWIAFGYHRLQSFFYNLCIFYFIAFVFGGGVFALGYLLTPSSEVVNGVLQVQSDQFGVATGPTFAILGFGFLLVFFLSKRSYQAIQEPRKLEQFLVEVTINLAGEHILCRGLVDTGNMLHEPITRTPVMVVEQRLFANILPPALMKMVGEENKLDKVDGLLEAVPLEWQGRIRLIPYRSVSRGMDFMVACKPEGVVVTSNGSRYQAEKVLIGISPLALSADGKYQAIVHPALMQIDPEDPVKYIEQEG